MFIAFITHFNKDLNIIGVISVLCFERIQEIDIKEHLCWDVVADFYSWWFFTNLGGNKDVQNNLDIYLFKLWSC